MVFLEEGARPGMTVPKLLAPQLLSVGRAGYSGTDYSLRPQTQSIVRREPETGANDRHEGCLAALPLQGCGL